MKCDKLQRHSVRGVKYNGEEICGGFAYYDAEQVDAAIAELKEKVKFCSDFELAARKEIEEMRGQHQMLKQFGHYKISPVPGHMIEHESRQYVSYNVVCMIINHLESEITDLKQKLEDVKASHYAEMVDAGMRERRLKRALWIARAERAKQNLWHDVNSDGSPKEDYKGHDWVLVQLREVGGFELIPRVAEYRRHVKRWVFIDEDYDTENSHEFRYLRDKCMAIGWRDIDFAYYGKKFFVQQEINKNVERKCLKKAEEYR